MSILKKIYDNFEECLAVLMLGTMILCLMAQVLVRMITGGSIAWTEELSRYTFLWSVYLGAALAAKRGAHVRVTAQFLWMKDKGRLFFRILADVIWIFGLIFVAFTCLPVLEEGFEFPEISATMNFAKAYVEAIIPFSFVLVAFRIAADYYIKWKTGTLMKLVRFEEEI